MDEAPERERQRVGEEDRFPDDDEEVEEVAEAPHHDFLEVFFEAAEQKKRFSRLPRLVKTSFSLLWEAGRRELLISTILQILTGAGLGILLLIGKDAADALLSADRLGAGFSSILPELLLLSAVTAAIRIAGLFESYQTTVLRHKTDRLAVDRILDVACAVELEAFESADFFDRLKRAELNAQMRPYQMVSGLTRMGGALVGTLGISAALFSIQPWLVPLIATAYVPLWLVKRRFAKETYTFHKEVTATNRERRYVQEVLTGRDEAKEVRAFGLAAALKRRWDRLYGLYIDGALALGRRNLTRNLVATLGTMAVTGGILAFLVYLVLRGHMSLAAAGVAVAAVQMMGTRVEGFLQGAESLLETSLFLEDVITFLDLKPRVDEARPAGPAPDGFSELRVEDVSFSYPGSDALALSDVSVTIRAGEIVALVGENGSGKTTLAKLLAGLYRPLAGRILWDGRDISEMDPEQVRRSIALIFQDFVRYKLPARENVGLGRHERMADLDGIISASRHARAHRFLAHLPKGYDTPLAKEFEGGRDLSIGQWQRVALARAFFRDAPFIILDEPTAALDPRAEKALFDSIRILCRGRSVLLISHRFSSVRSADRIYVLDEGRVVEGGSHRELMERDGLYAELFTLQASAYLGEEVEQVPGHA